MSIEKHIQLAIDVLVKAPTSEQSNIAIGILTRALNIPAPLAAEVEPVVAKKAAVSEADKKRNAEKVKRYREKKKQVAAQSLAEAVAVDQAAKK